MIQAANSQQTQWQAAAARSEVFPAGCIRQDEHGNTDASPWAMMELARALSRAGMSTTSAMLFVDLLWRLGPDLKFQAQMGKMSEDWGYRRQTAGEAVAKWQEAGFLRRWRQGQRNRYRYELPKYRDLIRLVAEKYGGQPAPMVTADPSTTETMMSAKPDTMPVMMSAKPDTHTTSVEPESSSKQTRQAGTTATMAKKRKTAAPRPPSEAEQEAGRKQSPEVQHIRRIWPKEARWCRNFSERIDQYRLRAGKAGIMLLTTAEIRAAWSEYEAKGRTRGVAWGWGWIEPYAEQHAQEHRHGGASGDGETAYEQYEARLRQQLGREAA